MFKDDDQKVNNADTDIIIEMNNYRYENGTLVFLDKNDKELGSYDCVNKDETKCMIGYYTQDDRLNNAKYYNEEEKLIEFNIPTYVDNYVFISDYETEENKTLLLYDITKQEVVGTYIDAKKYSDEGLILINEDNMFGVITFDESGMVEKIPFEYAYLGKIDGNKNTSFEKDGKFGLLSESNEILVSDLSDKITDYNDTNLIVTNNSAYNAVNYKKEAVIPNSHVYMEVFDNYIIYVNENKLYAVNESGSKLNEIGIELDNEFYIKTVIMDNKYNPLETNEAYELELETDGLLNINIDDNITSLNPFVAKLNAENEYVNYLDEIIYVYKDSEKTEILGSYECENKNNINKDSTSFNNCFIATESKLLNRTNSKDTLGYIPIYNNKYVFINDIDSSDAVNNIVLYDLINNKSMNPVGYNKVDVGYYNAENKIVSANTNELLIVAQNNKTKLNGIMKLSDTIEGFIPFDFESIEILNDGYLGKNESNEYKIFDSNGTELTGENTSIKNEVIDFVGDTAGGFIKVKSSDGKYLVYSMEGKVISNPSTQIILGKSVFLAADGNILKVYNYSDGKTNILDTEVKVTTDDFEFVDNGASGFDINLLSEDGKVITSYSFDANGKSV